MRPTTALIVEQKCKEKKMTNKPETVKRIEIDEDFGTVLVCALRYCIGRRRLEYPQDKTCDVEGVTNG